MTTDIDREQAGADERIPTRYWGWLGGTTLSLLGTQVLGFAMVWVAAGYGGGFAGLILTTINLPRTILLLVGGAIADRFGAWRVMIVGDASMTVVMGVFAVALLAWGHSRALLLVMALLIGIVDAFYIPSSGSMPRRLVPQSLLPQAMSARTLGSQLSAVLGGPLGAIVVGTIGLAAAASMNSASYAAMFLLLLVIRPRASNAAPAAGPTSAVEGTLVAHALDGLRLSVKDPLLRPALLMLVGTAAFLLPVIVPLLPVLARQQGWAPTHAGFVAGAAGIATATVAITVLFRGGLPRPGLAGCGGLAVAAVGILALALQPFYAGTIVAGALVGMGTGLFSTHIGPLVLGKTPPSHLARVQAVVALAQSLPLLVTNFALGSLAQVTTASTALVLSALALVVIVGVALTSPQLRAARRPG